MPITILQRIDESHNMARGYELSVQPGLFGDVSVIRHWGRIGTLGQSKEYWFDDATEADAMASSVLRQKEKRGYVVRTADDHPDMTIFARGQARNRL